MKLFHGSYTKVDNPTVNAGRRNLDFGVGFYVTNLRSQAEKWAHFTSCYIFKDEDLNK